MSDPFVVLGLGPDAGPDEIAAARRRLAKDAHPDLGGDAARMQELNDAARRATDLALARVAAPPRAPAESPSPAPGWSRRVVSDQPSFSIEALPAEAFEALLVATSWLGEVLVDEPPYLLEVHLHEPVECWCRLDLLPDAGASTVGITAAAVDGGVLPDLDVIRDAWVRTLNALDWDELSDRPPLRP